jgi:hypothetical protein
MVRPIGEDKTAGDVIGLVAAGELADTDARGLEPFEIKTSISAIPDQILESYRVRAGKNRMIDDYVGPNNCF